MPFDLSTAKPAGEFDLSTAQPETSRSGPSVWDRVWSASTAPARMAAGLGETALHVGSQLAAFPVQGLASAWNLATSPDGLRVKNANAAINNVSNGMIYQPRTQQGQSLSNSADFALSLPARGADWVGDRVVDATGSAGAGAATSFGLQAIPVILGAKYASDKAATTRSAPPGANMADATARAKAYVNTRTGLDWNSLSAGFQQKLTNIAQSAGNLDSLSPEAVARQARLEKLGLPATRGQVTRDLGQITTEENLLRSNAGRGIRDIKTAQDTRLHDLVSQLRAPDAPTTPGAVGEAVQGAARAAKAAHDVKVDTAYKAARAAGEGEAPASLATLSEWLEDPGNARNASFLKSAIADYSPDGKFVTINDLEKIRQEAASKTGGQPTTESHYAGQAIKVIDEILDNSGGDKYKAARSLFREGKIRFVDQGGVSRLVEDASRTDRRVALEDTFDKTVRNGSNEQLLQVKDLLTKDGSPEGLAAWDALKSATIDHLREKAAGKRAIPGEKGQLQFNSTFVDALHDLMADGKVETLFGKDGAAKLQEIADATRDVRTTPATRIAGSDTASRAVALFEKFAGTVQKVPLVGDTVVGGVKAVQKLRQMGENARNAKTAETLPVDEAAQVAETNALRAKRGQAASNALRKASPVASGGSQNALRDRK